MCPYEVEAKAALYRGTDPENALDTVRRARDVLVGIGAVPEGAVEQSDTYFQHPSRDFSRTDESIRVRSELQAPPKGDGKQRTVLTYKGPKVSALTKSRYEREVPLAEGVASSDMEDLLTRVGFRPVLRVRKYRTILDLEGVEVSLDVVDGLGAFAELEIISDDVKASEGRLLSLLDRLGWKDLERKAYLELLLEKGLNGR